MMNRPNPFRRIPAALRGFGFKQWFLLIWNIMLLLAMAASLFGVRRMSHTLESLTAAGRFGGESETRFAQLACYLPVDQGKKLEDIYTTPTARPPPSPSAPTAAVAPRSRRWAWGGISSTSTPSSCAAAPTSGMMT